MRIQLKLTPLFVDKKTGNWIISLKRDDTGENESIISGRGETELKVVLSAVKNVSLNLFNRTVDFLSPDGKLILMIYDAAELVMGDKNAAVNV